MIRHAQFLRICCAILALAICLGLDAPAHAQSLMPNTSSTATQIVPILPEPLTVDAANALISRLSDNEVRALLLSQLNTQAVTTPQQSGGIAELLNAGTVGVALSVADAFEKLPDLGASFANAFNSFMAQLGTDGLILMIAIMAIAIFSAVLVEFAFRRMVRNWVQNITVSDTPTLMETLSFLAKRLTADIIAVVIFFLAANMIGRAIGPVMGVYFGMMEQQATAMPAYIESIWINLIVVPRVTLAVARFLLAPQRPEFRIVHTDNATAHTMYLHNGSFALLLGLTYFVPQFFAMNGEAVATSRADFWLNLSLHLYTIWVFWSLRPGLTMMMRGADPDITPGEERAARIFPYFVITASVVTWWLATMLGSYGQSELLVHLPHIWTLTIMAFAPALDMTVRGLVRHLTPPMTGEGAVAERAYVSTRRSYIRIGRVIVFGFVVLSVARIWNIDLSNMAAAGVGTKLAGNLIEGTIILAVGYLAYESVSLWINRKLAAEQTASGYDPEDESMGGGDGGGAGGSRLSTVLPLILGVARAAIVVVFLLLALGNVGIDTTPLLAGAGIVGLAIGFGAQKLVTDVVSGIFFLIDDAFRTGEYVEVEGTMGTVEKISIRSMQLRHHKGPVHTLPYGEIPKITNYSRDWVIMKLRFTVPFGTDPNKVKKIFKNIGNQMIQEEMYKDDFLQPFKSQGVFEFDDVGIVIRGKFMAKPGTQFTLRKEIYNRINKSFEENGLEFARREVRVAIPGMDDHNELTQADKTAIAAAATQAAQEMVEETPAASKPGD